MQISTDVWQALHQAAVDDRRDDFERLLVAFAEQALRDERAAIAVRQRQAEEGPFLFQRTR